MLQSFRPRVSKWLFGVFFCCLSIAVKASEDNNDNSTETNDNNDNAETNDNNDNAGNDENNDNEEENNQGLSFEAIADKLRKEAEQETKKQRKAIEAREYHLTVNKNDPEEIGAIVKVKFKYNEATANYEIVSKTNKDKKRIEILDELKNLKYLQIEPKPDGRVSVSFGKPAYDGDDMLEMWVKSVFLFLGVPYKNIEGLKWNDGSFLSQLGQKKLVNYYKTEKDSYGQDRYTPTKKDIDPNAVIYDPTYLAYSNTLGSDFRAHVATKFKNKDGGRKCTYMIELYSIILKKHSWKAVQKKYEEYYIEKEEQPDGTRRSRHDIALKVIEDKMDKEKNEEDNARREQALKKLTIKTITKQVFDHKYEIIGGFGVLIGLGIGLWFSFLVIYNQIMKIVNSKSLIVGQDQAPNKILQFKKWYEWKFKKKEEIKDQSDELVLSKSVAKAMDDLEDRIVKRGRYNENLTDQDIRQGRAKTGPNVLLYGPPGTGKTAMAKSLIARCSKKTNINWYILSGSSTREIPAEELISTLRSVDGKASSKFYKDKKRVLCIIFVDEGDLMFQSRFGKNTPDKLKALTAEFLRLNPDGSRADVMWIITSNLSVKNEEELREYMDSAAFDRFPERIPFNGIKLKDVTLDELMEGIDTLNKVFLKHLTKAAKLAHMKVDSSVEPYVRSHLYRVFPSMSSQRLTSYFAKKLVEYVFYKKVKGTRRRRNRGGGNKGRGNKGDERNMIEINSEDLKEFIANKEALMEEAGIPLLNLDDYEDEPSLEVVQEEVSTASGEEIVSGKYTYEKVLSLISWALLVLILLLLIFMSIALVHTPLWLPLQKGAASLKRKIGNMFKKK